MDAWNNITFYASNKIGVGFRCRYRNVSYFNFRINGEIIELEHTDGFPTINAEYTYHKFSPDVVLDILKAYNEYNADQAMKYDEWRKQNAKLFS